jgi:hypothetical protein
MWFQHRWIMLASATGQDLSIVGRIPRRAALIKLVKIKIDYSIEGMGTIRLQKQKNHVSPLNLGTIVIVRYSIIRP